MQYLATLYDREDSSSTPGTPEWDAEMSGYEAFGTKHGAAILGGEALDAGATGRTLRSPSAGAGDALVTDGPFAETAEVIGGYYLLEAETLDDVVEQAADIPAAWKPHGAVEVRPLVMLWAPDEPVEKQPDDTRYLALIYGPEAAAAVPESPEWDEMTARHGRFMEEQAGSLMSGYALHPVATATTVRVRDGQVRVTDGPVHDSPDAIAGAYVVRAADPDAAVAVARAIPTSPGGAVELRPIVEIGEG